jgi:hypothetical protein
MAGLRLGDPAQIEINRKLFADVTGKQVAGKRTALTPRSPAAHGRRGRRGGRPRRYKFKAYSESESYGCAKALKPSLMQRS